MASVIPNHVAKLAADRFIAGRTYKCMLLVANTTSWQTPGTARDFNFVTQIAADEASDASYGRVTATPSTSEDDTNDRGEIHFADVTFPTLAAAVGEIIGVVFYEEVATDADHIIVSFHDTDSLNTTPNGEDFIVRDGAEGAIHFSTT